jgi:cytochrome c5
MGHRTGIPLLGLLLAVAGSAGCQGTAATASDPLPYLDDSSYRRAELEASLVNPSNDYSQLRLTSYDTGEPGDWSRLPEWNPAVDPIAASELDAPDGASTSIIHASAAALELPSGVTSADDPGLVALGEAAFNRYPVQPANYLTVALGSRSAASTYGLWVDETRGAGGLVRARSVDGGAILSLTCSTCHASHDADLAWVPGLPNARLDVGAAMLATPGALSVFASAQAVAAWGPGRLDVTTAAGTEPVRIADLRPVQWLTYLQADATVRNLDLTSLAIRIETLIITSNAEAVRPPRIVTLALAAYLRSLASALPAPAAAAAASPRGAALFSAQCSGCHTQPALTGEPVPLATVGTDPALGLSRVRGTGTYRVPSLHGVGTRGPLLHDATVPSLDAMFDPARVSSSFTERLHGAGAIPGHTFGLDLSASDRSALIAYLSHL